MDFEQKQTEAIDYFVTQAELLHKGSSLSSTQSLASIVIEATSHPSFFAFSEILSALNTVEVTISSSFCTKELLYIVARCILEGDLAVHYHYSGSKELGIPYFSRCFNCLLTAHGVIIR
ncbi:hypothetical protein GIB67_008662, partial [Kingdonia uniflora]